MVTRWPKGFAFPCTFLGPFALVVACRLRRVFAADELCLECRSCRRKTWCDRSRPRSFSCLFETIFQMPFLNELRYAFAGSWYCAVDIAYTLEMPSSEMSVRRLAAAIAVTCASLILLQRRLVHRRIEMLAILRNRVKYHHRRRRVWMLRR